MSEPTPPKDTEDKNDGKHDSISIIYHQRNDSPKYFEIKRSKVYFFFISLPAITLIALILGAVGLVHTSPFHLLESYRQNSKIRKELNNREELEQSVQSSKIENEQLKNEVAALNEKLEQTPSNSSSKGSPSSLKCPTPTICSSGNGATSIGLSTLSLFKPIQGQKDLTHPGVLNLSGFKAVVTRDTTDLQFNIVPTVTDDSKISGHILVLMKNELAIQAYPFQALGGTDFQINYAAGEPFSTQRFRPVNASFAKPKKSGNYSFTVFIFSRNGDLLHYQSIALPVKL